VRTLWLILAMVAGGLIAWRIARRPSAPHEINAQDSNAAVEPVQVALPDVLETEADRRNRRRSGETQKLERKLVHGPYRAIDDRGSQSDVKRGTGS
jgi:hypothetical protein